MNNLESWRERTKPRHEMSAAEIASAAIRLTNAGAQSTTFLLPDAFNYDASPTGNFDDTVEVSRVLKVAHGPKKAQAAVEKMDIHPDEKVSKIARLIVDNRLSTTQAIEASKSSHRLERLFGHPRNVTSNSGALWQEGHHFAYTQDFGRPLWEVFAKLDSEHNEDHLREACRIVDLYIDMQLFLCSKGLFDPTFKLLDNCAMGVQEELYSVDGNNGFMITDIGELLFFNLPAVIRCIHEKEWRKTALRSEYRQPSPSVRAYFDEVFDARFTETAVRNIWSTDLVIEPDAVGVEASTNDLPVLGEVAELLWSTEA
jgi:hypothetical protein